MKNTLFSIFMIPALFASAAQANTCPSSSPEMAQYQKQKNWQAYSLSGPPGVLPINGFVDENKNFYFSELSRGGSAPATLIVDKANSYFRDFFKYCKTNRSEFLRLPRVNGERNSYRLSMRYLPEMNGFGNNPLVEQKYRDTEYLLNWTFSADSSIDRLDVYPDKVKRQLYAELSEQLKKSKAMGKVELDLTGWDDVACDLIQGRLKLWLTRSGISEGATIEQKKEIEPQDIQVTYQTLKEQLKPGLSKEQGLFVAGRITARLEAQTKAFAVLRQLMNQDMAQLKGLDPLGLQCVADQLQTYKRDFTQHFIKVEFKIPALENVEAASRESVQ